MKPTDQEVLLIEDDARDVELTLREFKAQDFRQPIKVLHDGAEALRYLFNQADSNNPQNLPKAILIGWKLPKLDGLAVLRCLKETERTRQIPTFMLLSSHHDLTHLANQEIQPDGYLIKPVGFSDFARQFGPAAVRHFHANHATVGKQADTGKKTNPN